MKIDMRSYNLDSFSEKDVYSWDEIIAVIESLEEELHEYKSKDNDDDFVEVNQEYDEDRNILAYKINLGRND